MNEVDKSNLLELARSAIEARLTDGEVDTSDVDHIKEEKGAFVKLLKHQNLRGGMGFLGRDKPIPEAVVEAALRAAFQDPRFSPVNVNELPNIDIEISLIDDVEELSGEPETYPDQVEDGKHGLLMEGAGKAVLLPYVVSGDTYTPVQLLNSLAQKADLSFNAWKERQNTVYKFTAETFSE